MTKLKRGVIEVTSNNLLTNVIADEVKDLRGRLEKIETQLENIINEMSRPTEEDWDKEENHNYGFSIKKVDNGYYLENFDKHPIDEFKECVLEEDDVIDGEEKALRYLLNVTRDFFDCNSKLRIVEEVEDGYMLGEELLINSEESDK